jgi:hypothetical protein
MTDDLSVTPVIPPATSPASPPGSLRFHSKHHTKPNITIIVMNQSYPSFPQPNGRREKRRLKPLLLLPLAGLFLACASCSEPSSVPPPPPVTDTRPVGDGLKVIGFALLGAAVVAVLGRMLK